MIEEWLRHFELTAKARTGISRAGALCGIVAAVSALAALLSFSVVAFIWLAHRHDELTAALALTASYLVLAAGASIMTVVVRRKTIVRARLALQTRQPLPWLDPRLLVIGMEISKTLGWKKTVPIAAISVIIAGIAREWTSEYVGARHEPP